MTRGDIGDSTPRQTVRSAITLHAATNALKKSCQRNDRNVQPHSPDTANDPLYVRKRDALHWFGPQMLISLISARPALVDSRIFAIMSDMPRMTLDPNHRQANPAPLGPRVVLGVDPGLQCTGFAILSGEPDHGRLRLHDAGVIRLASGDTLAQRLRVLQFELRQLIAEYAPSAMACEKLYAHYKHPRTAILMGHARGVILAAAGDAEMDVFGVAATHVKKLLTGSGRASKAQVQRAVAALLQLPAPPEPHDVADAIAIGLAGLRVSNAAQLAAESAP